MESTKKILRNSNGDKPNKISHLYAFGNFELDPFQRMLLSNGQHVAITPKAFELLVALVERSGRLVEKTELLSIIWPDVSVEEGNLPVLVSQLRKALGDDRGKHEFIETVSKYGYRFVAPVTQQLVSEENAVEPSTELAAEVPIPLPQSIPAEVAQNRLLLSPWPFWIGGTVFALLAIGAILVLGRVTTVKGNQKTAIADGSLRSLAVLPFKVIGAQAGDELLGEGATDALVTKLGSIDSIVVRPTSAIDQYGKTTRTAVDIGKEQGVDAVLDGQIQRVGDRVRLTVQLVRVRDGAELWGDDFDEKFTNIFAMEDRVSDRVVKSLKIRMTNASISKVNKSPTENAQAYEAYVKGRYFWNKRTREGLQKGLEYFREAIRLDPDFAEAYAGVADSYAAQGLYAVVPPNEAFPAARDAAQKALQMDDTLADAHATLGLIHFYYDWDGRAAEREFRRALEINPNYAMAHSWNGEMLAAMGRFSEAVKEAKLALQDDPLSQIVNSNAGWTLCLAGQYESAVVTLKKALEMEPNFARTHFRLGMVYQIQGLRDQAIAEFEQAVQLSSGNPYYQAALASAYADSGRLSEVRPLLRDLKTRSALGQVPAFDVALVYAGLNDKEEAFQWLEKTPADHSTSMAFAKVDPALAGLRSDPRFSSLAKHLNF